MKSFRRILYATDFSTASRPAFKKAIEVARASGARLLIGHVLPSVGTLGLNGYVTPRMYKEMEQALRLGAEKRLERFRKQAEKAGVRSEARLLQGFPAGEIAAAAKSQKADLVVVGTHGRTGMARVLVGSVASRVIASAPCPVLAVRGR